jgi:hypothetical protein
MGFTSELTSPRTKRNDPSARFREITDADRARARTVADDIAQGNPWLGSVAEVAYLLGVEALLRDDDWHQTVPWLADMVLFGRAQLDDECAATAAAAVSTVAMIAAMEDLIPEDAADASAALTSQTTRRMELALSAW